MARFTDIFPDPEKLLQLEPEDVGTLLLQYFNQLPDQGQQIHRFNLFTHDSDLVTYAGARLREISRTLTEGWVWLEHEQLIAPAPDDSSLHNYFVTRRGRKLRNSTDYSAFKREASLAPATLDPVLAQKVAPPYNRGDYDMAILQAYKEVEVRVRKACAEKGQPITNDIVGTKLMSKAFDPHHGPLTNGELVSSEREATRNLFSGAIGLVRNPASHRDIKLAALEATELIHFANYLLRIVDSAAESSH